jgi:hypothetical protein
MWYLLNKVFGWDYVHWKNFADQGIAKIHLDGEGNPYYFRYKMTKVIDGLLDEPYIKIIWLTCKPDKYLKQ